MTPWFSYPEQQWREKHAVIVGAGIAGCQLSWHLTSLGWRVTLLECEATISSQASGNMAGIISPLMSAKPNKTEQFYQQAFDYATQQLKELAAQEADIDWFDCGLLQLAYTEREKQRWQSLNARSLPTDLIEIIDQDQASEIAGFPCHFPASYFPTAGFVNPASWCEVLINNNLCRVITTSEATSLNFIQDKHWAIQDSLGNTIASAEVVILCNGKNLNQFAQSKQLPLENVLGQTTLAAANGASTDLKCAINHAGYVTPSYKGSHVFGATFEREFEQVAANEQSDQKNLQQLKNHLPELATTFKDIKSGHASVRSATPDRLPCSGGLPDTSYYLEHYQSLKHGNQGRSYPAAKYQKGLFSLGGLGSRGLTSSALCAKALSELINNQVSTDSLSVLESLHPARFLIRQLRQGNVHLPH